MTLQIIGAGLGRTGTASLKVALELLGVGRCYHMGEALSHLDDMPLWVNAANGDADWNALFGNYSAALDFPTCSFWSELMDYYPNAKILLSIRDPDSWFNSINETIFSPSNSEWLRQSPLRDFFEKCVWKDFDGHMQDRDFMVNYYQQRLKTIIAKVPPERLLVYEVTQGWEPLCNFLQLEVPDVPFPRVNSREETRAMIESRLAKQKNSSFEDNMKSDAEKLFKENH